MIANVAQSVSLKSSVRSPLSTHPCSTTRPAPAATFWDLTHSDATATRLPLSITKNINSQITQQTNKQTMLLKFQKEHDKI